MTLLTNETRTKDGQNPEKTVKTLKRRSKSLKDSENPEKTVKILKRR